MGQRGASGRLPTLDEALRQLARRALSEAELRRRLLDRGHEPPSVDAACARLLELGYLDDRRLALDLVARRSAGPALGPARLQAELERRGVSRELAQEALRAAEERGELVPGDALRRRAARLVRGARSLPPRDYARVYTALLRAGFDEEAIRRELEPLRDSASHDEPATDEESHDFP